MENIILFYLASGLVTFIFNVDDFLWMHNELNEETDRFVSVILFLLACEIAWPYVLYKFHGKGGRG